MDNLTAGNPCAHRVRVSYIETSSTIYEGMPVCYNFDTTTNWFGGSASDGAVTTSSTLTAGSPTTAQAKYIEVELPDDGNKMWFAGVVAAGGWCGKTTASDSTGVNIDIYVPNGAIVPVRTDLYCTEGRTILAIKTDAQHLTVPLDSAQCRAVAVSMETKDRTTAGLVLAKLAPDMFIYQENTGDKFLVDDEDSANMVLNRINVETIQTTGNFTALRVCSKSSAGAAANGYGLAIDGMGEVSAANSGHVAANTFWLNLTGGTLLYNLYACECGIWCSGDVTLSSAEVIAPLYCTTEIPTACAPAEHYMMYFRSQGLDHPDAWFKASQATSIGAVACGATTKTWDASDIAIPLKIGSTTYYIYASDSNS